MTIFGSTGKTGENYILKSVIVCIPRKVVLELSTRGKNLFSGKFGTLGRKRKRVKFWWENPVHVRYNRKACMVEILDMVLISIIPH